MKSTKFIEQVSSWKNATKIEVSEDLADFLANIKNQEIRFIYGRNNRVQEAVKVTTVAIAALTNNNNLEEWIDRCGMLPEKIYEALKSCTNLKKLSTGLTGAAPVNSIVRSLPGLQELSLSGFNFIHSIPENFQPILVKMGIYLEVLRKTDLTLFPKLQQLSFSIGCEHDYINIFNIVLSNTVITKFNVDHCISKNLKLRFQHLERRNKNESFNPDLLQPIVFSEIAEVKRLNYCKYQLESFKFDNHTAEKLRGEIKDIECKLKLNRQNPPNDGQIIWDNENFDILNLGTI